MPPLTRQRTLESVLSWWLASNDPGATVDLHAAAKPLMKWMYHQQALDFIKKNHDLPLSEETLQIYSNYLGWKYVPHPTKIAILTELTWRANSEGDARVLVHSGVLYILPQLSEERFWGIATLLLERLGRHKSTTEVLDHVAELLRLPNLEPSALTMVTTLAGHKLAGKTTCKHLLSLLWEHWKPREIINALSDIALSRNGGLACIEAELVDHLGELLQLPNCKLPTLNMISCDSAASSDSDVDVQEGAIAILYNITNLTHGARVAMDAKVLDHISAPFASGDTDVRTWTSMMLEHLASNPEMAAATCERLVVLLSNENENVRYGAVAALSEISRSAAGARAAADARVLDHIAELVESPSLQVGRLALGIMVELARYG
ncbi:hypothetical protein DFH09DRAFT_1372252 [Mycena vulgaris]|nr:hypothetical protein DFH09DRAFT_1372252 [Mycena vulgaris]